MKQLALIASAILCSTPAMALEDPRPCSAADPRVRCVAYNENQVVRLYGAPGASLTVEFGGAEKIINAATSDNGLIESGAAGVRQAVPIADMAGTGGATADRNLQMARHGAFLFLKPLRDLDAQPITVLTQREDGKMRRYTFQLETREGELGPNVPNTYYTVRFVYPADAAADRQARWAAHREARDARMAAARLAQNTTSGESVRNARYQGQGDRSLAPSSSNGEPAMWDDGQRTYLRFPGNRRVPMIYQVLPDGREGVVGQSANPDPTTNGTVLVIHGVMPMLRLRDGSAVLCIANLGYDPVGRNPGTGTTSPDVVRELAPTREGRPNVR